MTNLPVVPVSLPVSVLQCLFLSGPGSLSSSEDGGGLGLLCGTGLLWGDLCSLPFGCMLAITPIDWLSGNLGFTLHSGLFFVRDMFSSSVTQAGEDGGGSGGISSLSETALSTVGRPWSFLFVTIAFCAVILSFDGWHRFTNGFCLLGFGS